MIEDSIVIGYVHNHMVDEEWARSLAMAFANEENKLLAAIGSASARHEMARNQTIERFLDTEGEWFMWIDTDQAFLDDAPRQLRDTAKAFNVSMAGGITYIWDKNKNRIKTNGFKWSVPHNSFMDIDIRSKGGAMSIDGTGSAFVLIHREVFEWHQENHDHKWHTTWQKHPDTDAIMGHDLAFFWDTVVTGPYTLIWDTSVESEHKKSFLLGWDMYHSATKGMFTDPPEGTPHYDGE